MFFPPPALGQRGQIHLCVKKIIQNAIVLHKKCQQLDKLSSPNASFCTLTQSQNVEVFYTSEKWWLRCYVSLTISVYYRDRDHNNVHSRVDVLSALLFHAHEDFNRETWNTQANVLFRVWRIISKQAPRQRGLETALFFTQKMWFGNIFLAQQQRAFVLVYSQPCSPPPSPAVRRRGSRKEHCLQKMWFRSIFLTQQQRGPPPPLAYTQPWASPCWCAWVGKIYKHTPALQ